MIELPDKHPSVLERFIRENLSVVYRYIVKMIITAIKENQSQVDLIKYPSGEVVFVKNKDFISHLERSIKIFIQVEDYEAANFTRKFLDSYYVDQLIKETSNNKV